MTLYNSGIDVVGCLERKGYIERLKQHVDPPAPECGSGPLVDGENKDDLAVLQPTLSNANANKTTHTETKGRHEKTNFARPVISKFQ